MCVCVCVCVTEYVCVYVYVCVFVSESRDRHMLPGHEDIFNGRILCHFILTFNLCLCVLCLGKP